MSPWLFLLVVVTAPAGCGGALGESAPSSTVTSGATDGLVGNGLVGNPAPDFRVEPLAGAKGALALKDLRGRVVVLDFWGTYCTPCKASFPRLQVLHAKYAGSGLQVVGISEDEAEDRDKIRPFAEAHGARFAIAWDGDGAIAREYKPPTMPSTFVIDRKGVVRYAHVGFREGDEVAIEREVKELLAR